ncbi:hypothetical protein C2L65_35430 [Paraburkholderia terrae]|uniref:Uncharacterized protein n=1 Tax=Paraburkholderia terrae TaxID=311230 RepID=A0A2I8EZI8_9BURK|nr:hypothetical protein C2L65_35430 [Paraburkholderia terrae]
MQFAVRLVDTLTDPGLTRRRTAQTILFNVKALCRSLFEQRPGACDGLLELFLVVLQKLSDGIDTPLYLDSQGVEQA